MPMRSWLFVPGDSEKKLSKVATCGADVVIVDLEDAVAPHAKETARGLARDWLSRHRGAGFQRWVRINALDTPLWRDDLIAVLSAAPEGIMIPKAAGPAPLQMFGGEMHDLAQRHGAGSHPIKLLPLVSETPAAALSIPLYAQTPVARLAGLTWGAEDLSAAIGATRKRDADGRWTDTFRMVRSQVLLAAHACGVAAIDTLYADFRDIAGLERVARESHADGFAGMLAIHPDQVPVINAAFMPTDEEVAEARRIVAAFAAAPNAGALQIEGRMLDQPHLEQARRLLASLD